VFPFLRWWPLVDRHTTRAALLAGLTGAILGLPQGVAFAILAGLPPVYGLYAAMVTTACARIRARKVRNRRQLEPPRRGW
jgi:SulP family sulfate permease